MQREVASTMLLAITMVATACAERLNRRDILGAQREIDDIALVGVTRFKKDDLLEHLHLRESPWLPFEEPVYYIDAYRGIDARRIVSLYKAHGYYDARVVGVQVMPDGEDEVDITITVEEGAPVRIESVEVVWAGAADTLPRTERSKIEEVIALAEGAPFEAAALEKSKSALTNALHEQGYPLAEAAVRAEVSPSVKKAWVAFTLTPGRRARIGKIQINGLRIVPRYIVVREIDYAPGARYSPGLLRRIEQSLYGMEVFRSVTVSPEDAVGPKGFIDIRVDVQESEPQAVKLGVELGIGSSRWEQLLVVDYLDQDLFGHLTRLDVRAIAGYAELPAPWRVTSHGPVFRLSGKLRKKGWLDKRLVWTFEPLFRVDIEEGYQYYSPGSKVGVSRRFWRRLEVGLSHHLRFYDFFDIAEEINVNRSLLGRDFRDPYMLGYGELDAHLYLTDRILDPRNGVVIGVTYDLAHRFLGSQYDFHKITPEIRGYWAFAPRTQIAAQVATGMIFPYGDRPASPINMKYFLGGSDTVRGWGWHRLSPRTRTCPDEGDCSHVPIGGKTMIHGSLELRVRVWRELYTVAFADAGDARAGEASYRFEEWNYSSGGGLRYDSPIGKFRADVGVRLNDTPISRGEDRVAFHLGLGEAF